MKRLLVGLALVLLPIAALSQMTATISTFFYSPKEFVARNISGTSVVTPYVAGNVDTMDTIIIFGTVKDSIGCGATSAAIVDFTVRRSEGSNFYIYTDTLRHSIQHIIPAYSSLGVTDSVIYFVMGANTVADGSTFELHIRDIPRVAVDSLQNVY